MKRDSPGYIAVCAVALLAALAAALWTLWPVYESPRFIIAIVAGLVGGALVAVPAALLRWSSPVVIGLSALMLVLIGVPVAVPDKALWGVLPTLDGLVDLLAGVALGWRQLLTIAIPVGSYQALLVPAFVLGLAGSVIALSLALRAREPHTAALVPLAVFVIGIAFGPSVPVRPWLVPIVLAVILLLWLVWLRLQRRVWALHTLSGSDAHNALGVQRLAAAAVVLALASVGAVGAAAALPAGPERNVLRTSADIPFDPRTLVSPLSGFRSYWQAPLSDELLFTVDGVPTGALVQLATLDTYDGVVYTVGSAAVLSESGQFTRVPTGIDRVADASGLLLADVQVEGYRGYWLPTAGALQAIEFAGPRASELGDSFYLNDVTGSAVVTAGLTSGDRYTMLSRLPVQSVALADLAPGSAAVPAPRLIPDALTARLEEYVRGIESPGERLQAMLDGLAQDGYLSHGVGADEAASRSGHGADRLVQLMTDPIMIGDGEQYAAAAALMAIELGFPARVVFGFVPDGGTIHGHDVAAWIEVNTAQAGWVAIDPNPRPRELPAEPPQENDSVSRPQTIVPPPVSDNETSDRPQIPETAQEDQQRPNPVLVVLLGVLRVAGWVLTAAALILAPFAAVIAAKLRRRRLRRNAPTVPDRIAGGWREFEDAVVDRGLELAPNSTRSEVAGVTGRQQAAVLAAVADHATFSPDRVDEQDAENVWRAVDDLTAALDDDRTRWQRLRARVSLRSLGGARGVVPVRRRS